MPEPPWEATGALGSTRPGAALTVEQCGPSSAVFGSTQATAIDAGRTRGTGNMVTLRRSPCHWHKEIAVCEDSLFIHLFLLSSPCFASSGKMRTQAWCGQATLSHHREQEHPACDLGIIWVHAWSSLCPSRSPPSYHCFLLESATPPSCLLLVMVSSFAERERLS